MKYPPLFKLCLIFLLFGTARIQASVDEECEYGQIEDGSCQKNIEKSDIEIEESDIHKSVFSETHNCDLHGSLTDNDEVQGSCLQKEQDDDQSELTVLEEQSKEEEYGASCGSSEEATPECTGESVREPVDLTEDSNDDVDGSVLEDGTQSEVTSHTVIEGSPEKGDLTEEGDRRDQDPDMGNVPLREILLKLKPEGLTDNEDDQPSEFSVTEASNGEDEEVELDAVVSSGSAEKQESDLDSSSSDSGKNGSGSSNSISKKAVCSEMNVTCAIVKDVEIINATMLMKLLQGNPNVTNRSSAAPCHLIYFFSPYCPFSTAGSPYVNAMARSLKNIPIYGLDSIEHHSVNARYGVTGTPTLVLFHNGNGVGRYNASEFSVMQLLSFINHYTDQSIVDINVTSADFRASLPTEVAEGRPYALWASWIFLLSCAAWLFLTSELCARLTEAILNNWREAEAQNDQD